MNAGQYERNWMDKALPEKEDSNHKINWMKYVQKGETSDNQLLADWISFVPGSMAPCHLVIAAIQAMRNKGYLVDEAEKLIEPGLLAAEKKDFAALQRITADIYNLLNMARPDRSSGYYRYTQYKNWNDIRKAVIFPEYQYDSSSGAFAGAVKAGWTAQLIGGALGTQIEGYTKENIEKVYGKNISSYLRTPETYNDDITYELVFLDVFKKSGFDITSKDIAAGWLEEIADGYSAERIALENLRKGIMPPESGQYMNYFSDWIGVQMRTPVHGMVCPGNPELAAKLAVYDGVVSHSNSGILGGMFNAILTSLAFVNKDMKTLVTEAASCLPRDSEYAAVISYALTLCREHDDWEQAWKLSEEKFRDYNWVHAYPNAVAEVIALWYGNSDFRTTTEIICGCGLDVDCTAAPVLNILGVAYGIDIIDPALITPLHNTVKTILRDKRIITIDSLVEETIAAARTAAGYET